MIARTDSGSFAISAMPPALSVIGPYASSATMMPAIDSIEVAAIAMPYRPASRNETQIATHTASTGRRRRLHRDADAGDDVGRVPGGRRLRDVAHRREFGRRVVLGDDDHRRGQHEADRPAPHRRSVVSSGFVAVTPPIIRSVMNQKPIAEITPATIRPR